jgi:acylphosphatase
VIVNGRVQGVWFRQSTASQAIALGVDGTVRNLPDGRVEAVFEGAPWAVDAAVEWCRQGPERAAVTDVSIAEETPEGISGFRITG